MSDDYFSFYEQSQTSIKRYVSNEAADGGFMELAYKGTPVIFDGSSGMAASHAYFLNTNYLELVVHERGESDPAGLRGPPVQPRRGTTVIIWMGNLVSSNRSLQGVHEGLRRTTCVSLL
jgi:hypothetical protein